MTMWIIVWLIGLILFLLMPVLCVPENRQRWYRRITRRQWNVDEPSRESRSTKSRLSKAQEDSIRESFIMEKLRLYTMTVTRAMLSTLDEKSPDNVDTEISCEKEGGAPVVEESDSAASKETVPPSVAEIDLEAGTNQSGNDASLDHEKAAKSLDDFLGDGGTITIPVAGECQHELLPEGVERSTRQVSNGCAICLSSIETEEKVSWASNPACEHVFHYECALDWFQASGRKHLSKVRREERRSGTAGDADEFARVIAFPMFCPCCRQVFVVDEENGDDLEKEGSGETEITTETLDGSGEAAAAAAAAAASTLSGSDEAATNPGSSHGSDDAVVQEPSTMARPSGEDVDPVVTKTREGASEDIEESSV